MKILLPVLGLAIGIGAGLGAHSAFGPAAGPSEPGGRSAAGSDGAESAADDHVDDKKKPADPSKDKDKDKDTTGTEFFKFARQFVIPLVRDGEVTALVTVTLSLESQPGMSEQIYAKEPKLRDVYLQVLFDHANTGGFDGGFTRPERLKPLRQALLDVSEAEIGDGLHAVLITEIAKQETF